MIYVIQIVNTHGIRGEVKALHYTDGEQFFKKVKTVYTKDNTPMNILSYRFVKGSVLLRFSGVDTPEAAQGLKFTRLYAKEEDLPRLPEGEFYFFELIGMTGILPDGSVLGTVSEVVENNAANLLAFTKENGKKVLIPNISEFVDRIDPKEKKIYITPVEGLIENEI